MGTISQLYKSLGGEIFILGKPSEEIYVESLKNFKDLDKSRIIAIGDSLHHDIKGANNFDIDSLLITSGIHKNYFHNSKQNDESEINIFKELDIKPTFLSSNFKY